MSVDTSTRKVDYSMTAIADYTFAFRALTSAPTDIKAKITLKSTDVVTALTYTTDYTVVINANGIGGTLSLVTTYGTTHKLTIYRETTDLQESDYNNYNQFPADTVETDLDRRTLKSQEIVEALGRCLQLDVASTVTSITLPPPSTGKALVWTGNTIRNSTYDIDTQQAAAASSATAVLASQVAAASSATAVLASQVAAAVSEANALIYANTASTQAIASATSATASLSHVTTALTYSNIASSHSVTALTHSNTAASHATSALTNATTAASEAVTALTHSNTASSYSVTALTHSNTASSHSVTALTQSNTATTQATISASHAVTALTHSNTASSYSVTALTHATTAGSHATSALTSATTAASEATTAIAAAATIPAMPSAGTSGLIVRVKNTEDGYELSASGGTVTLDTAYNGGQSITVDGNTLTLVGTSANTTMLINNNSVKTALKIQQNGIMDSAQHAFYVESVAAATQTNASLVHFYIINAESSRPPLQLTNAGTGPQIRCTGDENLSNVGVWTDRSSMFADKIDIAELAIPTYIDKLKNMKLYKYKRKAEIYGNKIEKIKDGKKIKEYPKEIKYSNPKEYVGLILDDPSTPEELISRDQFGNMNGKSGTQIAEFCLVVIKELIQRIETLENA